MLSSPARSPRAEVLLIAVLSVAFHLWLASALSSLRTNLGGSGGDDREGLAGGHDGAGRGRDEGRDAEGLEGRRLAGVVALLGIARLWSLCSAAIGAVGGYGVYKDRLPYLRVYTLNSLLTLGLDLIILLLILALLLSSSSSSSASPLSTTLCQLLSAASSPSSFSRAFLGLTLEACEDRFDSVLLSSFAALVAVQVTRGWAASRVLAYYQATKTRLRSGGRRRPDPLQTAREGGRNSPGERYHDSPVELSSHGSGSGEAPFPSLRRQGSYQQLKRQPSYRRERSHSNRSSHHAHHAREEGRDRETRILLLPRPEERSGGEDGVPALALTASSPVRTSFPPVPPPPTPAKGGKKGEGKVLVYAPVWMSPDEARTCGATELVLHSTSSSASSHRSSSGRHHSSNSHSSTSASSSSTTLGARSRSGTVIAPPPPPRSSPPSALSFAPTASGGGLSIDTAPRTPTRPTRQDSDDLATPKAATGASVSASASASRAAGGEEEEVELLGRRGDLEAGFGGGAEGKKLA
ncbi:hypothetical protein JCM8097_009437 [Rhodosporidiobolus ruineniae]